MLRWIGVGAFMLLALWWLTMDESVPQPAPGYPNETQKDLQQSMQAPPRYRKPQKYRTT